MSLQELEHRRAVLRIHAAEGVAVAVEVFLVEISAGDETVFGRKPKVIDEPCELVRAAMNVADDPGGHVVSAHRRMRRLS